MIAEKRGLSIAAVSKAPNGDRYGFFSEALEAIRDTAEAGIQYENRDHPGFYGHARHSRCGGARIVRADGKQEEVWQLCHRGT